MITFRERLLRGASIRTIFQRRKIMHEVDLSGGAWPVAPPGSVMVGIGEIVDLGDGNVAEGFADPSNPHGIRIEVRSK